MAIKVDEIDLPKTDATCVVVTRNMQIAKNLISEGKDINFVSWTTGLTVAEIRKL